MSSEKNILGSQPTSQFRQEDKYKEGLAESDNTSLTEHRGVASCGNSKVAGLNPAPLNLPSRQEDKK